MIRGFVWLFLICILPNLAKTQSLNPSWAQTAGGGGADEGRGVATTSSAVYVIGNFSSPSISFNAHVLTNSGENDIFLAKYDTTGILLWAQRLGGLGNDLGNSIAVSSAEGALYISGSYTNTITIGTQILTVGPDSVDVFLAKLDTNGNHLWANRLFLKGRSSVVPRPQVALDRQGAGVYVAVFDPSDFQTPSTILRKWTPDGGTQLFERRINSGLTDLSVDEDNYVHLAFYGSTITLNSGPPDNRSYTVSFFARAWYDATGYLRGAENLAGNNSRIRPGGYTAKSVTEYFHTSQFIPTGPDVRTTIPLYLTGSLTGEASTFYYHMKGMTNPVYDQNKNEFYSGTYPVGLAMASDTVAYMNFNTLSDSTQGADIYLVQKTGTKGVVQLITTRRYGNVNDTAYRMAINPSGTALYVIGDWARRTDTSRYHFGSSVLNNAGGSDLLLLKFSIAAQPMVLEAGPDKTVCFGGSVAIGGSNIASGGTLPYTYSWSGPNISNPGIANPVVRPSETSKYVVTVTDAQGAVLKDSLMVRIDSSYKPVLQATSATTFCEGGSVGLITTAHSQYVWSTGATNTNSIAVTTGGTYTVTATTAEGCTGTSLPVMVTVYPRATTPTITASGPVDFCAGDSVTLTAASTEPNVNFRWSTPQNTNLSNAASIVVKATNTYSVYAQNANCASLPASRAVTVAAVPAVSITAGGPTQFCSSDSVQLTAQTAAGNTLLWSNGATTTSIWVKTAGTYSVKAANSAGCAATSGSIAVTTTVAPAKPTITQNGNVLSSSAASGNQWYLNGTAIAGATGQQYTVAQAGNYTVQTTQNNCTVLSNVFPFVATGIADPASWNHDVVIYPNPVQNNLYISNLSGRQLRVQLTDMLGKTILNTRFASREKIIPLQTLGSGNYILIITDERKKETIQKILFKQ